MTEELKKPIFSGVDFQSAINNLYHRTSEITSKRLIVRRGDTFTIKLSLTQPFKPEDQQLVITAKTGGQHASEDLGTLSRFGYPDNIKRSPSAKAVWKLETRRISPPPDNTVTLAITPPADAPVGEYELFGKLLHEERLLGKLVVLFNPWSLSDTVYLSDEERRQEYVLNEHGVIFKGSVNYIFPAGWDYGQFEENMVDICLKILDRNSKHLENPAEDVAARSDPIYVGRVVSAMINSEDDNGVLEGSWDPPYTDGKRPTHWTGSYAILEKWFQEGRPVKYGQCWVFAGVMCSVLRLLGIPCRVVTNFSSAHDVDMNLTIDTYYDLDGMKQEDDNLDSVWNFHVWTEGWMERRDLGDNNKWGGWQALDPTPQETSDGIYCCGPAPVKAILDGYTDFKYDVPFVFAEVNADCIDWLVGSEGELYPLNSDTKRVGQFISTKCVGSKQREDITNTYKHAEGSYKERMTFVFATTRDYSKTDEEWWLEDEEFMEWMEEGAEDEKMEEEAGSGGTDGGAESGATAAGAGSGGAAAEAGSAGAAAEAGSAGAAAGAGSAGAAAGAGSAGTAAGAGSAGTAAEAGSAGTAAGAGSAGTAAGAGSAGTAAGAGSAGAAAGAGSAGAAAGAGSAGAAAGAGSAGAAAGAAAGAGSAGAAAGAGSAGAAAGAGSAGAAAGAGSAGAAAGAAAGDGSAGAAAGAGSAGTAGEARSGVIEGETTSAPPPPVRIRFKEVSKMINGKDVNLKLVLQSQSSDTRPLSIHISVQAMKYNGSPAGKILTEDKEVTLLPGKVLSVPIVIPFSVYHKFMVESESMKITAMITDKGDGENRYLATDDVVLMDPPITITAPAETGLNALASGEVIFMNPADETLTNCTLTLSGAGLFKADVDCQIPDLQPNNRIRVKFFFVPYKKGEKTITADFDCATFRDIKGSCTVNVV